MSARSASKGRRGSKRGLALALVCALFSAVPAAAQTPLERAEHLLRARQPAAALAQVEALTARTAAERERILWVAAAAHIQRKAPATALPLLEALVSADPASARYRFALGRVLLDLGRTDRARHHLERALDGGLEPDAQLIALEDLERIERTRKWSGHFRFALAPDSNPAARTSDRQVEIGGLPFTLGESARAQPGTGLDIGGSLHHGHWITNRLRVSAGGHASALLYRDQALTDIRIGAVGRLDWQADAHRKFTVSLRAGTRWRGGKPYSDEIGLNLAFARRIGPATTLRLEAGRTVIRHDSFASADGHSDSAAVQVRHGITPALSVHATAGVIRTQARAASESGTHVLAGIGADLTFPGGLMAGLSASVGRDVRDGPEPLFGTVRRDVSYGLGARFSHRDVRLGGFAPVVTLSYKGRRSTLAIHDYDRFGASLGLTRAF
ncbi:MULTISPECIES: surface lipoprotein assembly modifier [unclassified Roseitalea]|uniref:surface lipoprotein assembly modifier n=1 Tax=unclassified Roseitalea TaxID=2639107 RepID=UPI00273F9BE0|nr:MULTISPECIES: surface lipoprotein assembly modifier [unclassified Roseitalea]